MPSPVITIDIEARLAKLEEGVRKANGTLDRFGSSMGRLGASASAALKASIAGFATAFTADVFIDRAKAIVDESAALIDLADSLGTTVEAASRLNNQVKIAGGDFAEFENAALRLAKGMAGADEESTRVKETLKLLGVTTKDPLEALQQVALKLDKYAGGVNKVAIAAALFGDRAGPKFLATLKDIAELQDVGATVTERQAAQAEELGKAMRRLSIESEGFKNIVLSGVVPAITNLIAEMKAAQEIAGGFFAGFALKAGAVNVEQAGARIRELRGEIEELQKSTSIFGSKENPAEVAAREKEIKFLEARIRLNALASIRPEDTNVRDRLLLRKPEAPPPPPKGGAGTKDRVSEAERYLESLQKQLDRTSELTVVEQFLRQAQMGRIDGLTPALREQILIVAKQIDDTKELEKWVESSRKAWDEETKSVLDNTRAKAEAANRASERAAQAFEETDRLRDEIAIILGGDAARKALEKDRLDAAIATREQDRALRSLLDANADELASIDAEIDALRERRDLLEGRDVAEKLVEEVRAIQSLKAEAFDVATSALENFIVNGGKASDVLKQLERDLVSFITRQAFIGIKDFALGTNSGPNLFSVLASFLGGGGGGGSLFGGAGGLGYAATGSDFTSGGPYVVGERGPEIVVPPRGSRVIPNDRLSPSGAARPIVINQTINVQGQVDSRTARQIAAAAGSAVGGAGSRG